jgi:hypothetical protein
MDTSLTQLIVHQAVLLRPVSLRREHLISNPKERRLCLDVVGKKPWKKRRINRSFQCEKERKQKPYENRVLFLTGC